MAALRIAVAWCAVAAAALGVAEAGAGWNNIPRIPAGRRAQFYLQKDDGGYLYGYDTGDGASSAQAAADAANEVQGAFAWRAADGRPVGVRYSAGRGGYRPQVDGAPAAPISAPAPAAPAASAYAGALAGAGAGTGAGEQQDADYDANADASYSFNIDTDSYKRTEQSDARGNVRGQYSYSSAKGGSHALSYAAGEGTGFVVTGASSSPSSSSGPASAYSGAPANADGSYSFAFGTDEQSRQESADAQNNVRGSYSFRAKDDGKLRRVDYSAGAGTGFVASGDHLPVAPEAPAVPAVPSLYSSPIAPAPAATPYSGPLADIQNSAGGDGSYSFAFGTDLQSRQESADALNNVRGSYSFRAKDDGKIRRVDYEAGAATGFVARGDHLPVAPSVGSSAIPSARYPVPVPAPVPATPYSGPASNAAGSSNADGSYSFSFSTNDQSRQEAADARNNVRGSYSFRSKDDGKTRRVDYVAGADTGFVASGDHLPVAPEAPAVGGGAVTISSYAAPAAPIAPSFPAPTVPYAASQGPINSDGSYSFSFNTNDQSRQEAGDSQNNVRGSYSFTAPDDGQTRRVDYEAGSSTGFIAKGAHLPVAPAVPAVSAVPSVYSAPAAIPAATPYSGPASNAQAGTNPDGSYSFSFSTNEQSRQESSDAQNNVRGSYSFRAKDDGQTRRVDYVAGASTGFVAQGDHLPKAPPAPSSAGAPAARVGSSIPSISRLPSPSSASSSASASADGSYSFAYDAGDHSRQEASDAAGNVRGSFSFVAKDDGQARRVHYSAGAATGFLASGAHLPVAGASAPADAVVTSYSSSPGAAGADGAPSGDASYSYSYQTDSSSKTESADSQGNVRGEYSYRAGDGATRRVAYTARDKEGFVASGDLGPAGAGAAVGSAGVSGASVVAARAGAGSYSGVAGRDSHGGITVRTGGAVINQYLPPDSSHKFGYIYDTKA